MGGVVMIVDMVLESSNGVLSNLEWSGISCDRHLSVPKQLKLNCREKKIGNSMCFEKLHAINFYWFLS